MSNLLPPTQLTARNRDLTRRLIMATAIAVVVYALIIILGFLPAYLNVRVERSARALVLKSLTATTSDESRSEQALVQGIRKRINVLERIGKPQQLTAALQTLIDERPRGVTVYSFAYVHKDGVGTMHVVGNAPDSKAVQAYVESLKRSVLFEKVTVPLTALTSREEGVFSIIATGVF